MTFIPILFCFNEISVLLNEITRLKALPKAGLREQKLAIIRYENSGQINVREIECQALMSLDEQL